MAAKTPAAPADKPKKIAKLASNQAEREARAVVTAATITRHTCHCGCRDAEGRPVFIPLKELLPIRSAGVGHSKMVFYIRGHEAHAAR